FLNAIDQQDFRRWPITDAINNQVPCPVGFNCQGPDQGIAGTSFQWKVGTGYFYDAASNTYKIGDLPVDRQYRIIVADVNNNIESQSAPFTVAQSGGVTAKVSGD